jgi:3-(3-hydroxy-phenyl)propionate hydroxylase
VRRRTSIIRKAAGIEFPGWDATKSNLIAEVEMTEEPDLGTRHDAIGVHGIGVHGIGRLEYEIRDGEVVYKDGGAGAGDGDRAAARI